MYDERPSGTSSEACGIEAEPCTKLLSEFGLGEKEGGNGEGESWSCGDVEREAPAVVRRKISPQQVSGSGADRDGEVEDAENAAAFVLVE